MGKFNLEGSLQAGPPQANEGGMSVTAPLIARANSSGFGAATGILQRRVSSPAAFIPLTGVGANDTVTRGTFLYLKSDSAIDLRVTHDNGAGVGVVVTIPVQGLQVFEFQDSKYLRLLEVQGSALIEYFVCGSQ